ncbi:MAG TPA: TonB-dependent receptor [Caldithrix abyssi]|uniref:TonB-dependent receptor n=1 Tax=Caldithrix abyssi TaxID=187145 RepID=A0A7V4WVZ2_CALAY|nr:TonB-dependent receptor [Caldithrix abyssi]
MRLWYWILILFTAGTALGAIRNGRISGKIKDIATHQALVGANVVVEGTGLGAASDFEGNYFISGLMPGSYNVSIYYLGYQTVLKSNVVVNPDQTTVLSIGMEADVLQSESIEVTASYFEKPHDAVMSARSVDMEEIRRSPGASLDIQRVMQALPAVVSASDQNNEIIIRGGNPGENLFLMDEIEIPNPNHFSEQGKGGGPINMINTLMVRNVDFYAGAFPAQYGDKASSVMNIALREGSRERFRAKFDLGMAGAGILLEGPLYRDRGTYIFSARKSYLDLLTGSIGLSAVPRYHNLQGKLTYDLSPANTLIINALYGADAIKIENEGSGGYARGAENVDTNGKQYVLGAVLRTTWNPKMYSKTTVSLVHSDWNIDVYRFKNGGKETYFENKSSEEEITLKSDFSYQIKKNNQLSFGASYKRVRFNPLLTWKADTVFIYDVSGGRPDSVIGIKQIYPAWQKSRKNHSYKVAAYAQISTLLLNRIRLSAGLRYQYFDYNDYRSLSPRLGVSYLFGPKTTLSLSFGKHFQTPPTIDFAWNEKNRSLSSYSAEQVVLGFEKIIGEDIKSTVEVYYKTYINLPVFKRHTTSDPFDYYENQMLNLGEGKTYGVELFFQKKLTRNFSTIVSYSYSRSQAKDLRTDQWYDWDYDYRHVFTFIGGYKIRYYQKEWFQEMKRTWWYKAFAFLIPVNDEIEWSLKYRYLGGRPYTEKVYHPEYKRWLVDEGLPFNGTRLPEYSRFDVRLDRRFFFDSWNLVNYFDISNIFNHKNIWEYQYNNEDGTKEAVLQFQPMFVGGIIIEF